MPYTHAELVQFISSLLPRKPNDIPLLHYHVSRSRDYDFDTTYVDQVILSVTPTANVYSAIEQKSAHQNNKYGPLHNQQHTNNWTQDHDSSNGEPHHPTTIAFFHRPFTLDHRRIGNNLLVLASHTSFDENLTVGWNPVLAARLGIPSSPTSTTSLCIQGYKDDPTRRIGTLAKVSMILGPLLQSIENEFGSIEHAQEGLSEEIHVFAMMNAFSADEVDRVLDLAAERNWVPNAQHLGRHVLYLTGEARKSGLQAAKRHGLTVVCVGKRVAEQWGITYMGGQIKAAFPGLEVKEIYEDEMVVDAQLRLS